MDGKRKLAAVAIAGVIVVTGGCGKAAEKISEKTAEHELGKNSKVKIDGDNVSVDDGKGNKVAVDSNGVHVTSPDGSTMDGGVGTKLPDGWPDELKPPKGVTIVYGATGTSGGKKSLTATGTAEATVKELYNGVKSQLTSAGYTLGTDSLMEAGGDELGSLVGTKGDTTVTVAITSNPSEAGKSTVNMAIEQPA
jgi:hypothetical protein